MKPTLSQIKKKKIGPLIVGTTYVKPTLSQIKKKSGPLIVGTTYVKQTLSQIKKKTREVH